MKVIKSSDITSAVEKLCIESNFFLSPDIKNALINSVKIEESDTGKIILNSLIENAEIAAFKSMPICQDTGMAVVFIDIGQDIHVEGDLIEHAINIGVKNGYKKGYLRASIVGDPINRVNTEDNTPAIIHYNIVKGDKIKITVAPKGFGSENMSAIKMLTPSAGINGVKQFILDTIREAGSNPCPPIIVGVGIGGTIEKAAFLAKKALLRPLDIRHHNNYYSNIEIELLHEINNFGIGPGGLGGRTTALALNIETYPTHIAGLPVAVNISCHATRHAEIIL
jgi:fumarate hydratase subunit alpha